MSDNEELMSTGEGYPEQIGEEPGQQTKYLMIRMFKMSLVMVDNDEFKATVDGYPQLITCIAWTTIRISSPHLKI